MVTVKHRQSITALASIFAALVAAGAPSASAQAPNLAGKTVNLIVGSPPGGSADIWGRVVARHIGKHLPGQPSVVLQHMPGAGGTIAANYIYGVAPKDGTAMAHVFGVTTLGPLRGETGARFDATQLTWVGAPKTETNLCIAFNSPNVKVKTLQDLYEKELVVGNNGVGTGPYFYPKALNALVHTKFKIVGGFPGMANIFLAMERGELEGVCGGTLEGILSLRPNWIPENRIVMLFYGGTSHPKLKDVPSITELAKNAEDKAVIEFLSIGPSLGRVFIAPPGMTTERVKMLQEAFTTTMKDPDFLADATKQQLDVEPRDGEYLSVLIRKIYATPKSIVDKVVELTK
jgi:tripartite-type tricarboxylate transporter receptor subunit TctC